MKKFLILAFLLVFCGMALAYSSFSSASPPYEYCRAFLIRDSDGRATNGAAKVDPKTGNVWLAVAKDDLFPMPPYYMGAYGRIMSKPVSIVAGQNIRVDVNVTIPPASIVRNPLAETLVYVQIQRVEGGSIKHIPFIVDSGAATSTRNLVVMTDAPPGAGDYKACVDVIVRATANGGLGAIGNGFKINNIAVTARK